MNSYVIIVSKIIENQHTVMGPLAFDLANKVNGLKVESLDKIVITGNGKDVLKMLVDQYSSLFGRASVEVCRDAVKEIKPAISSEELPVNLK